MKYGNRSVWQKIIRSPLALFIALMVCVILAKATWSIHQKASLSATRLEQAQAQMAKLEARRTELSAKVDALSTPEGVEAEIRSKYRAVKAGESVAVIVDDQKLATSTATSSPASWWGSILRMFGLWN